MALAKSNMKMRGVVCGFDKMTLVVARFDFGSGKFNPKAQVPRPQSRTS